MKFLPHPPVQATCAEFDNQRALARSVYDRIPLGRTKARCGNKQSCLVSCYFFACMFVSVRVRYYEDRSIKLQSIPYSDAGALEQCIIKNFAQYVKVIERTFEAF